MAAAAAVTAAISQSAPVTQMQNWMRLCLGSECYNKEAVRNVLHNKFNNPAYQGLPEDPVLLFQELKKNQPHLSKLKSKKRITKAQWKLLYPDTKQTHSREFDIPLMVILLEHCTDLDAPVNGWDDSTPPLTDQGLSANSLRARQMRHFLYHYGNPISMDKNEFLRKWTDLEDIQSGLGCATVDMLDLKTGPLDPHKLTYFKCAITYLEEGQKKLLGLHEGTASDVKMLIDEVSTLKESQKNFPDIDARVVKIISQYSDLCEQVQANKEMIKEHGANIQKNASRIQRNIESLEKHDIDIENLTTKVEDMKSHEDLLSSGMRWNIPENVSNFYGRTSVLDTVRRHFQNSSYERDYVAVVLSGLGGIGKTEVAVKYVSMYDKEYENVIWLECNDLKTSLMRLALYLEIERNVFEIDVLTQLICRKLKNSKCMFVLNDTVDGQSIKEFMKNLKNMKNTPCVLITSQYSEWDDARIKNIPMDVLEPDEAVGFLCECFPKHDTVEVEMLARELQYLPLALQQARSYIKKHDRTIPDYISYLADNRKELLNVRLDKTGVTEYGKTLLTVWKMAFDKLKEHDNSLAIDILNMMAYMDGRFINIQTFLYLDNIDEVELS
ncbi:uncharacterized protein LOC130623422 [Hydractinia symbiolongicarpus]|uniref:uncharacterized protein LOC130623422 n=1 Tax=Hydractinia symbiolongicarpus TaxID=13093 RepID=UPI00254DD446|nr:uncharacterized protein LOC130623422 [Hydractinia symbiolongicarpus]